MRIDEQAPDEIGGLPPAAPRSSDTEAIREMEPVARSQFELVFRRFLRHKMAVFSVFLLLAITVLCLSASWIAPFGENQQELLNFNQKPDAEHWFGTDEVGRDVLSRILYGGQISLKIGVAVALLSTAVGTLLGAIAGYFGGWIDNALMRLTDLFLVVPSIAVLAIALRKFGNKDITIILILAAVFWMVIARVVRGQVLSIKEKEYVEAARASGASNTRIIARHILPNVIGPIVVNATLAVAAAIITESTLSFLGFGVQPPQTSWGNMLARGRSYIDADAAHLVYFPGLAILITVLAINFIGDGLRDAFDPQSKH
ncbi:MAG TPA: ABC transporter permease [Acidimicrobiia bacterium]|nr:ABC transporter permease [Acidimicrobiia bacterium]